MIQDFFSKNGVFRLIEACTQDTSFGVWCREVEVRIYWVYMLTACLVAPNIKHIYKDYETKVVLKTPFGGNLAKVSFRGKPFSMSNRTGHSGVEVVNQI